MTASRKPLPSRSRSARVLASPTNKRILAYSPGRRERTAQAEWLTTRAEDWNGPRVQLAQGEPCRTAGHSFGSMTGNGIYLSACLKVSEVLLDEQH